MNNGKVLYLTIDDGPSKYFRDKINFLILNKIPAIFFCRGDYMELNPNSIIYAIKNGFLIGNHSFNHPPFSKLNTKDAFDQIRKTDNLIERFYVEAGMKRPTKLFRFPYGDRGNQPSIVRLFGNRFLHPLIKLSIINNGFFRQIARRPDKNIQEYLKELGYCQLELEKANLKYTENYKIFDDIDILWTYDIEQSSRVLTDIIKRIDENLLSQSRENLNSADILLMHDHEETTDGFYKILAYLIKKRAIFKNILDNNKKGM